MKTRIIFNMILFIMFSLIVAAFVLMLPEALAQSAGNQGNGIGQQDQDRIQDPTTSDGDEPDQDRDRIQLNSTTTDVVPDQDRDQLQTQDQDRIQDPTTHDGDEPDQDQDRDRLQTQDRINSPAALQDFVFEQNQIRARNENLVTSGTGTMVQTRTQAVIATDAFLVSEFMLGTSGPRMGQIATEMNQAIQKMAIQEEAIQNRSKIRTFFFGHDEEQVQLMQQEIEQNRLRMEELKRLLSDCNDCNKETIDLLVEQYQFMEAEQNRVRSMIDDVSNKKGIFGFLFGWL